MIRASIDGYVPKAETLEQTLKDVDQDHLEVFLDQLYCVHQEGEITGAKKVRVHVIVFVEDLP